MEPEVKEKPADHKCRVSTLGDGSRIQKDMEKFRRWGPRRSGGPFFTKIPNNGKWQKLRTYILIDISLVDEKCHFPANREAFNVMMFRASENVKEPHEPIILEPPKYST